MSAPYETHRAVQQQNSHLFVSARLRVDAVQLGGFDQGKPCEWDRPDRGKSGSHETRRWREWVRTVGPSHDEFRVGPLARLRAKTRNAWRWRSSARFLLLGDPFSSPTLTLGGESSREDTSPFEVLNVSRGTDGSNPASSSEESGAKFWRGGRGRRCAGRRYRSRRDRCRFAAGVRAHRGTPSFGGARNATFRIATFRIRHCAAQSVVEQPEFETSVALPKYVGLSRGKGAAKKGRPVWPSTVAPS
jgi:hypothetical protein